MPKQVQIRRTVTAIQFESLAIKQETKILSCDVRLDPTVRIMLVRLELIDYPQCFLRCPVKNVFENKNGTGTIIADIPAAEIERLNRDKVKFE